MSCIVTTVGASLFTNYFEKAEESEFIKADYEAIKDSLYKDWEDCENRINNIKNDPDFRRWISHNLNDSCAEIASLLKILRHLESDSEYSKYQKDELNIRLLATDTIPSGLAAELIMGQTILHPVTGKKMPVDFFPKRDVITGLRVDDAKVFQKDGLQNFIHRFSGLYRQYEPLILNVTGGYKGLIPYLTLIGQIREVPVMYKFEESEALITIPQWPVNFDGKLAVEYGDQLQKVTKINEGDKKAFVKKHILDRDGDLTPLGIILKDYAKGIDRKDFLNKNLRGDCAEFRWFEYYVSEYPGRMVRRSVGKGKERIAGKIIQGEADIVVEGDEQVIIAESKSCKHIHDFEDKLLTQINQLLQELKDNEIDLHEYHLCLYSSGAVDTSEYSKHSAVLRVGALVSKYYPECGFVLNLMRNVYELQSFMHKSFSEIQKDIKPITIPAN